MTNNNDNNKPKEEAKVSRRNRVKYPALDVKYNLPHRTDFLDCPYVNGVRNNAGDIVIRGLTEAEKEFLNKFNAETVVTSYSEIEEDNLYNKQERREFFKENNHRFLCQYNKAKRTGNLISLESYNYDLHTAKQLESVDYELIIIKEIENNNKMKELVEKKKRKLLAVNKLANKLTTSSEETAENGKET